MYNELNQPTVLDADFDGIEDHEMSTGIQYTYDSDGTEHARSLGSGQQLY